MGNTFFQAVGGLPQMGFAGHGRGGMGFGSLGAGGVLVGDLATNQQALLQAARDALTRAAQYPQVFNYGGSSPEAANQYANLMNQVAAVLNGGPFPPEAYMQGWINTVQSFIPATAQTAVQSRPDLAAIVQSFYNQYYNRGADAGGLEFFTQQLIDGVSQQQVAAAFVNSAEYQALHPVTTQLPPNTPPVTTTPPVVITQPPIVTTQPPAQTADDTITLPLLGNVNKKTALLIGAGVAAYFLLGK